MRNSRTSEEVHAIESIVDLLRTSGSLVDLLDDVTDKPDALFRLDGELVAAECRGLTPRRIMELYGVKLPEKESCFVYLPLEPHVWVREAIESKEGKVPTYLQRSGASSAWLILHGDRGRFMHLVGLYSAGNLSELFEFGAGSFNHPFERVYLAGSDEFEAVCLFDRQRSDAERWMKKSVMEFPVHRFCYSTATAEANPDGTGSIRHTLNQEAQHFLMLQPLDKRFLIDYSVVGDCRNYFEALRLAPPQAKLIAQ